MPVMDQACNLRLDSKSSFRCHGNLDYVLTPTGDKATISGTWARLQQQIILWASTPLGEDIDPKCGCILHKYLRGKYYAARLETLELELTANLKYNFPDYIITGVRVVSAYDDETESPGITCTALFNSQEVAFFADAAGLLELRNAVRRSLGALAHITNAKG